MKEKTIKKRNATQRNDALHWFGYRKAFNACGNQPKGALSFLQAEGAFCPLWRSYMFKKNKKKRHFGNLFLFITVSFLFFSTNLTAQAATEDTSACMYTLLSTVETNIRDRAVTTGGIIGSANYVEVGSGTQVRATVLSGGTALLRNNSYVAGDITAVGAINKSDENSVVVGGIETPNGGVTIPVIQPQDVTPGTENITIERGGSRDLSPGNYGEMTLRDGATLTLNQGTYHFSKFVSDGGNVNLIYNLDDGPINVLVSGQLSFGDRNVFAFVSEEQRSQVHFYTSSSSQVKIGTDCTFYGTVTAPNAQVYVFSNVDFYGAIHAKQIWIDADSTVTSSINCGELTEGISFEDACDVLSFQPDTWNMNPLDDTAYISPTDFLGTSYSGVYEVHLGDEIELEMVGATDVLMDSTDTAGTVDVSIDVYSTGVVGQDTVGTVDLYIKSSTDASYQYAGGFLYEREENPFDASMSRFNIPLGENLSKLVKIFPSW